MRFFLSHQRIYIFSTRFMFQSFIFHLSLLGSLSNISCKAVLNLQTLIALLWYAAFIWTQKSQSSVHRKGFFSILISLISRNCKLYVKMTTPQAVMHEIHFRLRGKSQIQSASAVLMPIPDLKQRKKTNLGWKYQKSCCRPSVKWFQRAVGAQETLKIQVGRFWAFCYLIWPEATRELCIKGAPHALSQDGLMGESVFVRPGGARTRGVHELNCSLRSRRIIFHTDREASRKKSSSLSHQWKGNVRRPQLETPSWISVAIFHSARYVNFLHSALMNFCFLKTAPRICLHQAS